MLVQLNPSDFDRIGVIEENKPTVVRGEHSDNWTAIYPDVRSMELPPLRGDEKTEGNQKVNVIRKSFVIRLENRTVQADKMRYVVDGVNNYVHNVRNFKGSRNVLVMDTQTRDNE